MLFNELLNCTFREISKIALLLPRYSIWNSTMNIHEIRAIINLAITSNIGIIFEENIINEFISHC